MNPPSGNRLRLRLLPVILLLSAPGLFAQNGSTPPDPEGNIGTAKDKTPTNYENSMNRAPSRETNAFKVFQAIPDSQFEKKVKAGEDFLHKFGSSSLVPQVYSTLAVVYIQAGQSEKGFADGEKALALNPKDVRTMANLAQAMSRLNNPNDAEAPQRFEKASQYAQECIRLTATLPKPEGVTDEEFAATNNKTLAMAHSALGLIHIRRGQYSEAIPDLQEATRLDDGKDATNFYLLGIANENSSHFAEAAEAFAKCLSNAPANLEQACREGAAEAEKHLAAK